MSSFMQFHNGVALGASFIASIIPSIAVFRVVALEIDVSGEGGAPVIDLVENIDLQVKWTATLHDGSTIEVGTSSFTIGSDRVMLTTSAAFANASSKDAEFQESVAKHVRRLYAYHDQLKAAATSLTAVGDAEPTVGSIPGISDAAPATMPVEEINNKIEARHGLLQAALEDAGILGRIPISDSEPEVVGARKTRASASARLNDFDKVAALLRKKGIQFEPAAMRAARALPLDS